MCCPTCLARPGKLATVPAELVLRQHEYAAAAVLELEPEERHRAETPAAGAPRCRRLRRRARRPASRRDSAPRRMRRTTSRPSLPARNARSGSCRYSPGQRGHLGVADVRRVRDDQVVALARRAARRRRPGAAPRALRRRAAATLRRATRAPRRTGRRRRPAHPESARRRRSRCSPSRCRCRACAARVPGRPTARSRRR